MTIYLLTCLLSSICIVTTWRLFNDDASFMSHIPYILFHDVPAWIRKPLYECMFCMSSVWGLTWFTVFNLSFALDFYVAETMLSVFVIAGMVSLLQGFMVLLDTVLSITKAFGGNDTGGVPEK